ncbi:hypothetical protein HK104_004699 [Borealophlyctis nickersoniae]|nr:hypothetical protein HK104_004699 [Borealophlyctis nickersoniae]
MIPINQQPHHVRISDERLDSRPASIDATPSKVPELISALRGSRAALEASQENLARLERQSSQVQQEEVETLSLQQGNEEDEDLAAVFRKSVKEISKKQFEIMRREANDIEDGILDAETEVIRKSREAFQVLANERSQARLVEKHNADIAARNKAFKDQMEARRERKTGKVAQRKIMRDTKARDLLLNMLELASLHLEVVNNQLRARRREYDGKIEQLEASHSKQLRQIGAAHERRISTEKRLVELEMSHIKDEVIRQAMQRKFHMRATHQRATNKRMIDQLLAFQAVELRQAKETYELDTAQFEEEERLIAKDLKGTNQLQSEQMRELNTAKERYLEVRESVKQRHLQIIHENQMKKMMHNNRLELRKLQARQSAELKRTLELAGLSTASSVSGTRSGTRSASTTQSAFHSNAESEIHSPAKSRTMSRTGSHDSIKTDDSFLSTDTAATSELQELADIDNEPEIRALINTIEAMKTAQRTARQEMRAANKAAMAKVLAEFDGKRKECATRHAAELEQMSMAQQLELSTIRAAQEKEIAMEESVHDAEANALSERKTLNHVLNAMGDGIINMDEKGRITRANLAVETMFGYPVEDLIGKDIRMLLPIHCRQNGKGRQVTGKKYDGTTFPCHVAISEVTAEGIHLFTGILRDLTHEIAEAERAKAIERARQAELEAAKNQADDLLHRMFPSSVAKQLVSGDQVVPQNFAGATVFFSDVVGFTEIASKCSAIQMVDFLNDLYGTFDSIISQYDAYKVETIGDCYMVVSGVPKTNGDLHAGEIAKMALHLVSAVKDLKFKGQPDLRIKIRVGLCTGPVAAGVVGNKMPRYCLFGDTVNVASRMESTGLPMQIHVTESTFTALQRLGGYHLSLRGGIQVKGKGQMRTYWLTSKDDFDYSAPVVAAEGATTEH